MTLRDASSSRTGANARAGLWSAAAGALALLLRLAAGLLAFVVMLGALLVGAALALGLVVWALVRGRRPAARVFTSSYRRMRPGVPRPGGPGPTAGVIDIEAREVPEDGRPTTPLRPRG